jgi:1-phosphofructokinase
MPNATSDAPDVLTVTLNPALDRTLMIPAFAAGTVNRVEDSHDHPGGKGLNVAVALRDAGHIVATTGLLGHDNAAPFVALLAERGIADQWVRIAGQTRVSIKIIDPIHRQTTDINFPGLAPSTADLNALSACVGNTAAPWVVLAGSVPPQVPPTIYRDLIRSLKANGRQVVLDTSGLPLQLALEAAPQIVKPNLAELESLVGAPLRDQAAMIAAAQPLLADGIQLVVVSLGSAGALFLSEHRALLARPPLVAVQSTVGAGDAMVAGIVSAHLRGMALNATARLATAFAADTISRLGAGLSAPNVISALIEQVTVEAVD